MQIHDLMAAVNEKVRRDAIAQGIQSVGEMMATLKAMPQDALVVVDRDGKSPSGLSSYRGYYERLSIQTDRYDREYETKLKGGGEGFDGSAHGLGWYQPGASGVEIAEPVTVAEFLKALDLVDGETFEGYKGGQYRMDRGSLVHVAEYGSTGVMVVGVALTDGLAVILTADEEW